MNSLYGYDQVEPNESPTASATVNNGDSVASVEEALCCNNTIPTADVTAWWKVAAWWAASCRPSPATPGAR